MAVAGTAVAVYYLLHTSVTQAPLTTAPPAAAQRPDSPFGTAAATDLSQDLARLPPPESVPQLKNLDSAEATRVTNYLAWMSAYEKLQQAKENGASSRELSSLANAVDRGIDARLDNREMSSAEALHLKSALLELMEPDPSQRVQLLAQWRDGQANKAVEEKIAAEASRAEVFRQEQSRVVLAWNALPPPQRDAQQLESQLQALRERIFNPVK